MTKKIFAVLSIIFGIIGLTTKGDSVINILFLTSGIIGLILYFIHIKINNIGFTFNDFGVGGFILSILSIMLHLKILFI